MTLATIPKPNNTAEIEDALKRAAQHVGECDSVLVIMQKKKSGMLWFAPDNGRIETASFLATSFLHWLHSRKEKD